jgi:hypothetical protein
MNDVDMNLVVIEDCVKRAAEKDPDAGYDLSLLLMGEIPTNSIALSIALVEILLQQSAHLGSVESEDYLNTTWPEMKEILIRRLKRKGMN